MENLIYVLHLRQIAPRHIVRKFLSFSARNIILVAKELLTENTRYWRRFSYFLLAHKSNYDILIIVLQWDAWKVV